MPAEAWYTGDEARPTFDWTRLSTTEGTGTLGNKYIACKRQSGTERLNVHTGTIPRRTTGAAMRNE